VKRIRKGKPRKLQPVHIEDLKTWVEQDCRRTLRDLADRLEQKYGVKVCESTLWNYLEELHFSVKRISPIPISRNTPENIEVRRVYGYKFLEMDRERDKVFYIDETGIAVHTRLNYGRSRRGQRANLTVRAIRGKNYSVCMAMNWKGIVLYEPQDKAFNSFSFAEFLKKLIDKLQENGVNGAYLVMDNASFHHTEEIQNLMATTDHQIVYLPPYSPFLNPIENLFNQFKYYVKRFNPTNPEEVFNGISLASQVISESDCQNYYSHMMTYIPKCIDRQEIMN